MPEPMPAADRIAAALERIANVLEGAPREMTVEVVEAERAEGSVTVKAIPK